MKKLLFSFYFIFLFSCGRHGSHTEGDIITVSISPFKYFVEQIAGHDFTVNVMVPPGANPHIYEPYPGQISNLRKSVAYISNGHLGFEITWLDRFYEANRTMVKLSASDQIDLIEPEHSHEGNHSEGADPHYWLSPKCALIIAASVKELLIELNPNHREKYEINYRNLIEKIEQVDEKARQLLSGGQKKSFLIFHPNLQYLARDYGLEEISLEHEGKEPSPSRMKELIDRSKKEDLKVIFVQKEYDIKNAQTIADETGAEIVIIDPLSEDWFNATMDIVNALYESFVIN